MNKTSSAIVIASLSAMAQQAYAQKAIEIDQGKVSEDVVNDLMGVLSQKEPHQMIGKNFQDFSDQLFLEGVGLGIDVDAYLAQYNRRDSVGKHWKSNVGVCYTNCHSACHGSRGWR